MQVQVNAFDPAILAEARKDPHKYPHLLVRVSGYSAYFNDLTDAMKDEIIHRTLIAAVR
jgi:formate C-acetyltransferase